MRNEYGNAQLECSAADERSKLLASEVIGLEEKVYFRSENLSWFGAGQNGLVGFTHIAFCPNLLNFQI